MQATKSERVPCLQGGPLASAGNEFVERMRALGNTRGASIVRAWCVAHIFHSRERIFESQEEPVAQFTTMLRQLTGVAEAIAGAQFPFGGDTNLPGEEGDVESITGDHYANLFGAFTAATYWDEPLQLLSLRLERNGISLESVKGKSVLDAGCGGGRYTGAWRKLGAKPALGIDISESNVQDATRRVREAGLDDISFQAGNVLALPTGAAFDIVFSNGVLHHTLDWRRGIAEMLRVLAPGGLGWLYVIENPGGLFWDSIEILRMVMAGENRATARHALRSLGLPPNRVFYMLDHVMAPVNVRLTPDEVEDALVSNGAIGVRRLTRGADFDRVERIYQKEPFAVEKFGVGENRYLFSK